MQSLIHTRIVVPLVKLLAQGMPADRIALSLAVGLSLSVIPILGVTTGLCLAAALTLRLNVAAMQLVNWLATPLQLALLLPFYRAGAHLAGLEPVSVSPAVLLGSFRADPSGLFASIGSQMLAGTLLWLLVALPAVWLFAQLFLALLHRLNRPDIAQTV